MSIIATITGQSYRAAHAVTPSKDVRYYLNGLYLDIEAAKIVSTDGSMLYLNDIEISEEPGDYPNGLIFEPVKVPVSAKSVTVSTYDDKHVMLEVRYNRAANTMHICKLIDGKYPNYKAVLPKTDASKSRQHVGFDVKYLAKLKQIFKRGAKFYFDVESSAIKITGNDSEGTAIIMEMRV